jgi:delta14-sterol reductase
MIFVCMGQLIYIADSVWFEQSILTTIDITTDGFGFMLVVGDIVWVPFTYTMQARYLVSSEVELDGLYLLGLVVLFLLSYATFRGSNSQKNNFRTLGIDHPSVCY